jgi:DNA mismatch repair protein MutS
MGLAWAVGEDLHSRVGARTLFATHFHELTGLADQLPHARNYCMAAREQGQEVVFLYRLIAGGADRSYGIQVARLAGIPDHVVERARAVLARLESTQEQGPVSLREISPPYLTEMVQDHLLVPADDEIIWAVLRELFGLDIANLTPVQALVVLNEMQQRLRGEEYIG